MNYFGTDGIRGKFGEQLLNITRLPVVGNALAQWAYKKYKEPKILIAHDTRVSCALLKALLKSSLLQYPIKIFDAHVLPTPAVAQLLKNNSIDCGIIISASHNAFGDNGIKIIDAKTGKLSQEDEQEISFLIDGHTKPVIDYTKLGTDVPFIEAEEIYCARVISLFSPNFLANKKIILDCAHGATYHVAPKIFSALGADIVTMNTNPNGVNINNNCGALALTGLQQAVLEHNADYGFAFDGDGDRVIVVSSAGSIKNGDDILALLTMHKNYRTIPAVVGTVMTNFGLEKFLLDAHKKLLRTAVGDKYVAERLVQENLVLGGEQSGHIIATDYGPTGDGIVTALLVLESSIDNHNVTLETFEKYPQVLLNVPITVKKDLTLSPLGDYIALAEKKLGEGRIVVRFSGTEPLLRIMVEASSYDQAVTVSETLACQLSPLLIENYKGQ